MAYGLADRSVSDPRLATAIAVTMTDSSRWDGSTSPWSTNGVGSTWYCRSGAGNPSTVRTNPPASARLDAYGPRARAV